MLKHLQAYGVLPVNRWTFLALVAAGMLIAAKPAAATIVRFQTSSGNIDVRLYDAATPASVANFLNYANTNRYDGSFVHRVPQTAGGGSANFVVQGGGFHLNNSIFAATAIPAFAPVADEPGISNLRGTLAMAKTSLPNTATSQWYFNVGNNSFLDGPNAPFTVFGRVVRNGMTVVDAINNLPTVNSASAQNQPGEDFDEIPVYNRAKVISQQDLRNEDAVMILDVAQLAFAAGDYNFDGRVDAADLGVWQADLGSRTKAEADGNGNGIVDQADYDIWLAGVPEPSSAALAAMTALALVWRRTKQR